MSIPEIISALVGLVLTALPVIGADDAPRWVQSYDAGYVDDNGAWAGGSEVMHIVTHDGKLFAANGYWLDSHWDIPPDHQRQSAQVLRLDSSDGRWQVDLDTGRSNGLGLGYMKGNILKSVTFTRDADGHPLPEPRHVLVMAAGANFERGGAVSAWVRDDESGQWHHTLVRHGSSLGGVRWVPRDMQVYRDKVTGVERLFLLLGNPGVITGVCDSGEPGQIRWARNTEFPFLERGSFRSRPLGIVEANGSLFFSVEDAIYRRIDGERPTWIEVINFGDDPDTDVGGIRGLTAVENPNGPGQSLLFVWAPGGRSRAQLKRLDPDRSGGFTLHDELAFLDLMSETLGVRVSFVLAGHNMMYPVQHPETGETVHIIGFQGNIHGRDKLRWPGSALYAGAMYAIRRSDGTCTVHEVNNRYSAGKPVLVSPRAFCLSPFGDNQLFVGGHDCSNRVSDNMAWILKAPLDVALGLKPGLDSSTPEIESPIEPRLQAGPVYELRTYTAARDRMPHLLERFREHTDRVFRKHNMIPVGYWRPTEGPPLSRRQLVYLLKHPSRYDAWQNWVRFTNDREWQEVLDRPEFQRLLMRKPDSVFMTADDEFPPIPATVQKGGGAYELRTYTTQPDRLPVLHAQFEKSAPTLKQHGITTVGVWTPFDEPDASKQLIALMHHSSREQADRNWQKLGRDSQQGGTAPSLERVFLRATDFSALK